MKQLFLWDRLTAFALQKRWRTWDQAKDYCLALGFGGFIGALFLWALVASLCPFNFWAIEIAYYGVIGFPCEWLIFLSLIACFRLASFTSAVPYGKPCRVSLDDKIWIRLLVWWRRNVKHLGEYDLVASFSKHHNNQHPIAQATERKYALKVIFGY